MRPVSRSRRLGLLAAVLLGSLTLAGSSGAGTTDTEVLREPFTDVQYNPCVDELVTTTGVIHVVEHKTTTQNGETDTFSFNYEGMTAVGMLTGVRYIESHVENQSSHVSSTTLPMEVTDTETLVLNRVAPNGAMTDDDYLQHAEAHLTISASGQVSDHTLDFKPECR
jgi:hypothetical protein